MALDIIICSVFALMKNLQLVRQFFLKFYLKHTSVKGIKVVWNFCYLPSHYFGLGVRSESIVSVYSWAFSMQTHHLFLLKYKLVEN